MVAISERTEQFLEQVKDANIAQLVEADKANWLGKKDNALSAKEIQKAFMEGTLTRKVGKDGTVTSSATYISIEEAERIVQEISAQYPNVVFKDGTVGFRQLKAELDPAYKKISEISAKALVNPEGLDEIVAKLANKIEKSETPEAAIIRK